MRITDIDYVEKTKLHEGVQYGNKQKSWTQNNLNKFRIGLEAELAAPDDSVETSTLSPEELGEFYEPNTNASLSSGYLGDDVEEYRKSLATAMDVSMSGNESFDAVKDLPDTIIRLVDNYESISDVVKGDDYGFQSIKAVFDVLYSGKDYSTIEAELDPIYHLDDHLVSHEDFKTLLNFNLDDIDTHNLVEQLVSLNELLNENDMIDSDGTIVEGDVDDDSMEEISDYFEEFTSEFSPFIDNVEHIKKHIDNRSTALYDLVKQVNNLYRCFLMVEEVNEDISYVDFIKRFARYARIDNFMPFFEIEGYDLDDGSMLFQHIEFAKNVIETMGYGHFFTVVDEGDNMIEVISTGSIVGDEIEEAVDALYEVVNELISQGFSTRDGSSDTQSSGLHVSISMPSFKGIVNPAKFLFLSNILQLLPEDSRYIRKYVNDIRSDFYRKASTETLINSLISNKFKKGESLSKNYDKILIEWADTFINDENKHQTVNFASMDEENGRIEIRIFGGEGYENTQSKVWEETLRSMYALHLASSETEGRQEYLKILNQLANDIFKKSVGMDVSQYYLNIKKYYEMFSEIFPMITQAVDFVKFSRMSLISVSGDILYRSVTPMNDYFSSYIKDYANIKELDSGDYDMVEGIAEILSERLKFNGHVIEVDQKLMRSAYKSLKPIFDKY